MCSSDLIGRQADSRQIAIVGAGLERFGAVVGDSNYSQRRKGAQLGKPRGIDRFDGQNEASFAGRRNQHHRNAHPDIGSRPRELFVDVRCKGHEIRQSFLPR